MKFAILYTLLALILAVVGFYTREKAWFIGAVIVGFCAFYWIWKSRRIPVRAIVLEKTLEYAKLICSKDKKEVERGNKMQKKIEELLDKNKKYKGKLNWKKELEELEII